MIEDQVLTFRDLIAPTEREAFFAEYYSKKPLYIPGPPGKFDKVFSWEHLNGLLDQSTLWTARSLELALHGKVLEPKEYCYSGRNREGSSSVMKPDIKRVVAFVQQGATLVVDFIETLTPGVRSVAQTLESVTGAPVCCSAFCSWDATPGYGSHFDTQNVFAAQIAGTKTWRVYEGRMLNPAEIPGYTSASFSEQHHERAKGKVAHEITMTPGDLLYLPAGQYHDALASDEGSLHVSFGACESVGMDFINILVQDLPKDPLFREPLPHFDDDAAHQAYLRRLADRLREIITEPGIARQLHSYQRGKAFERFADFHLPERDDAGVYRVRATGARLIREDADCRLAVNDATIDLDHAEADVVAWALQRDYFAAKSLAEAFAEVDSDTLAAIVEKLLRHHLIEPI